MEDAFSKKAIEYLQYRDSDASLAKKLGAGQDGFVWESSKGSALKVFERDSNFVRELQAYEILSRNELVIIKGFNIPQLIGFDKQLRIIEMTIVVSPYILDFGKAYFKPPDYPEEVLAEYEKNAEDLFGAYWPNVQEALYALEVKGIWYVDANPRNISCSGLKPKQ